MLENAIILLEGQELEGERATPYGAGTTRRRRRRRRPRDAATTLTRGAPSAAGVGHKDVDAQTSKVGLSLLGATASRRVARPSWSAGSRCRIWWDVTTAILLVYVAIAEPFVVVFAPAFAQESSCKGGEWFMHGSRGVVLLNFRTGYVDANGVEVLAPKSARYITRRRGSVWISFLVCRFLHFLK